MEHEFEDEIEFFSFLPSEFHTDLYKSIEEAFDSSIAAGSNPVRRALDSVESAVEKNMLIFERFALRNIFTFPAGFVYDRRKTAEVWKGDLKALLLEVSILVEKRNAETEKLAEKRSLLKHIKERRAELEAWDADVSEGVAEIFNGIEKLNELLAGTLEIKKKFLGVPRKRDAKKEHLLGNREVLEHVNKRECDKLAEISSLQTLTRLNEVL